MKCPNYVYTDDPNCKKHMMMKTIAQAQENPQEKKLKKPKIVEIDEKEPEEQEEIPVKFELSESQKKASMRLKSQIREVSLDEQSSKTNSRGSEDSRSRPNKRETQYQKLPTETEEEYEMEEMEEESELPEFNPASYKSKAISMAMDDVDESEDVKVRVMDDGEVWDSLQIRRTVMGEGYYMLFSLIEGVSCKYGRNISGLTNRLRASEAIQASLPYAMDDIALKTGIGKDFSPSTALMVATAGILAQSFMTPETDLAPKQTFPQPLDTSSPSDSPPSNNTIPTPTSEAAKARLEQLRKANPDFIFDEVPEEAKLL